MQTDSKMSILREYSTSEASREMKILKRDSQKVNEYK